MAVLLSNIEFLVRHWFYISLFLLVPSVVVLVWVFLPTIWGAPWLPSSLGTVRRMLDLARVRPGQKVVDLGAGDGRIVILAALLFKARAVGVEIDPVRCLLANTIIRLLGLRDRARIEQGDLFGFDLSDADVVTLFLLSGTNHNLRSRLAGQLRPGAIIASHKFPLTDWVPVAVDEQRRVFVYEVGRSGPRPR
jgi:SAM-dependent methyltransferase